MIQDLSERFRSAREIAHYLSGSRSDAGNAGDRPPIESGNEARTRIVNLQALRLPITRDYVKNTQSRLKEKLYGKGTATKRFIKILEQYKQEHGIDYWVDFEPKEPEVPRRFSSRSPLESRCGSRTLLC